MHGPGFSTRRHARAWVRGYVRAACDAGQEGLAAATPITRDQLCGRDPSNANRLASAPDFSLMLSSDGGSVVLTWVRDGASERFPLPHGS